MMRCSILYTFHSLLQKGNDVHIIVDGVSSQQPIDREVALQRLSQAGAFLTTAQSAASMLMQSKFGPFEIVVFVTFLYTYSLYSFIY